MGLWVHRFASPQDELWRRGGQAFMPPHLTDTNGDQGALRLVPGFHHRITAGWWDALEGRDPRRIDLAGEAVPIAANAGDLVIWRQELPHGASANTSQRPRMVQYVTMYPMRKTDTRRWL